MQTDLIQSRIDDISDRVRNVREARSLTLVQLSQMSGVAPSTIQKIENRQMTPSITILLKIAAGLGVEPPELIAPSRAPVLDLMLQRAGKHPRIQASKKLAFEKLSSDLADAMVQCWRVHIAPGHIADINPPWKLDEHIFLCEQGQIELVMDGQSIVMQAGDTLHFRAKTIYRVTNTGPHPAIYLFAGRYPQGLRGDLVSGVQEIEA